MPNEPETQGELHAADAAAQSLHRDAQSPREDVWIVILAAGLSTRMGRPKPLLPARGTSLIRHVASAALRASSVSGIVVVCGTEEAAIRRELDGLPVAFTVNPQPGLGLSGSLAAGIRRIEELRGAAAVVLLGDQPDLRAETIDRAIGLYRETGCLAAQARYEGKPGHPVLLDRRLFPELLAVEGDVGARDVLALHRKDVRFVDSPGPMPVDLDTPQEYELWLRKTLKSK